MNTRRTLSLAIALAITFIVSSLSIVLAAGPRILPEGKVPEDWRLQPPKDLDGYFPFTPPQSQDEWKPRAEYVKRQMLVACGIWPQPTKTDLNAVIHGKVERDGFTVERVFFEAVPGFYVTSSLYRPTKGEGKRPGVLCPHGHWANGRFHDAGAENVKKEIAAGAEKHEESGRSPLQARCATLARMGCVVFHYDMLGYADSTQLSFELVHRFGKQRPEANDPSNWGFYSPQAESHLQSVMGLQIWAGIRAIDFLQSLPDVDPERIAVTGASGGGTQTMILAAIDPRVTVSIPAVMVSTAMQGGCTCENCSLLRVGTGNIEFAALFAPKPQLIISANDWTKEMATKGFPEIKAMYHLLKADDKVAHGNHIEFGHNYNYVNRGLMYNWVNEHFKLGHESPIVEEDFKRLSQDELTVWNSEHPKPEGGFEFEKKLTKTLYEDAQKQLLAMVPKDEKSRANSMFKEIVGGGLDVVIGRKLPDARQLEYNQTIKEDRDTYLEMAGLLNLTTADGKKEQLPIVFLYPKDWNKKVVIWIDPRGKAALFNDDGPISDPVKKLMRAGTCVVGVDLMSTGEFLADGKPLTQTPRVKNPREAASYTFGFNSSLFAQRVHDILTTVAYVKNHSLTPEEVIVVGLAEGAGPLVAAARAQAGGAIDRAVIDTRGFRFGSVKEIHDVNFLPGGAKYLDLPGMLAVAAPGKLWLAGEGQGGEISLPSVYKAAGAEKSLTQHEPKDGETAEQTAEAAIEWILKP
jgi:dienelactone hydrolase